jgi:uncharacterized protein YjbJ (UPF0337 family)
MLNWNLISEKWNHVSPQLKTQWDKLTDTDLQEIDGSQEALTVKLQERYGFLRMDAEKKVNDWGLEVGSQLETMPKLERPTKARVSSASNGNVSDTEEPAPDARLRLADEERPEDPSSKLTPPMDRRNETRDHPTHSSPENILP